MNPTGLGVPTLFEKVRAPLVGEPVNLGVCSDGLGCQTAIFNKLFKTFVDPLRAQFDMRRNLVRRQYRISGIIKNLQYLAVGHSPGTTAGHSGFRGHGRINCNYLDKSRHVANRVVNIIMVATNKGGKTADRPGTEGEGSNGPEKDRRGRLPMKAHNDRARKYDAGPQRTAESPDDYPDGRESPTAQTHVMGTWRSTTPHPHHVLPWARDTRAGGVAA